MLSEVISQQTADVNTNDGNLTQTANVSRQSQTLKLSFFNNKQDNKPKPKETTWQDFLTLCETPPVRTTKDGALFSPASFNGTRAKQNVDNASAIVLDYDHEADWNNDLAVFRDWDIQYIAYTSHSHLRRTESNPNAEQRFRAVVPLTKPIPAQKYPALWKLFYNLSEHKIDRAASDASRMFYLPAKASTDAPYKHQFYNGEPFDWESLELKEDAGESVKDVAIALDDTKSGETLNELSRDKLKLIFENLKASGKFDLLMEYPKFAASWNKERKDLNDKSQSPLDMSLANYAALEGCSYDEIMSLLVENRGDFKRDDNGQIRWDYLKRTITKGQRWAAQVEADRERQLALANEEAQSERIEPSQQVATSEQAVTIEECNDIGNARRFKHQHGADVRYCPDQRKWYVYNGQRWQIDATLKIQRLAKDTAISIAKEALSESNKGEQERLFAHAQKTKNAAGIKNMLQLAESELPIRASEFDKDVWLLNCKNGTLDLRTGQLREHRREDFITKLVDVEYDPLAACPTWLAFLNRIMDGNEQLISFLRRAIGYSLTGEVNERAVFILHGVGANGKSVFTETIFSLLGDYATVAPASAVMERQRNAATNDIAKLKDARFVSLNETEANERIGESTIKAMSGDDTLTARFLYAEYIDFKPQFKFWLRTNYKPSVRGTDEGIWDRLKLIPFAVRIPKHEQDKQLAKKLRNELSGILAWAVRGCIEWQAMGLGVPQEVEAATNEYRNEQNTFAQFIETCCILGAKHWCSSSSLRQEYERFCEERGETPDVKGNDFAERLRALGCDDKRERQGSNVVRGWSGIGLLTERVEPMSTVSTNAIQPSEQ